MILTTFEFKNKITIICQPKIELKNKKIIIINQFISLNLLSLSNHKHNHL